MRATTLAALALLGLGLVLAGVAQGVPDAAPLLHTFAGLFILAAALSFGAAFLPKPPPHAGVAFRRPGASERWCAVCGNPAPRTKPCVSCGSVSFSMRQKTRSVQRKSRPSAQEKKPKN